METRRDKKLRSLLKKFEIQTPPSTFTDEVVREIDAMAEDKVYASARLKGMLQKNVVQLPTSEFTYKVLNSVREGSRAPYPPIIGKRAWALIGTFLFVCVVVAFIREPLGGANSILYYLPVGEFLSKLTLRFAEPLFYSALILGSAGLLLVLDYFINKRLRSRRSG